jgi:DNA polymerase III sliding clamp (beta) subunit (PCNA family)
MGMKISIRQNSLAKNISLISPIFNANLTRIFPFKNTFKINNTEFKKTISRLGISYNMEAQNRSTLKDSLIQQADF